MLTITDFLREILGQDLKAAGLIVLNLIIIESLLSVDNAAVLATMVMDLPKHQRAKALKYGIIGAYVFRGLCLLFASVLIKVKWLKLVGGLYLLWLTYQYFFLHEEPLEEGEHQLKDKKRNKLFQFLFTKVGPFWSTVALVELMDLAFSIDNVFAAVAFTDNIYLIWIGVFIGILTMRLVASGFVNLMQRFPFLSKAAFIVIGILGLKLVSSFACEFYDNRICNFLNGHAADMYVSILTVSVFIIPIIFSFFLKRKKINKT